LVLYEKEQRMQKNDYSPKSPKYVKDTFEHLRVLNDRYDVKKYYDVMGGESSYLEKNFLFNWYYYKYYELNLCYNNKLYEIKNYPSFFLYQYLLSLCMEIENREGIMLRPLNSIMN
jgi:hypothetical protein